MKDPGRVPPGLLILGALVVVPVALQTFGAIAAASFGLASYEFGRALATAAITWIGGAGFAVMLSPLVLLFPDSTLGSIRAGAAVMALAAYAALVWTAAGHSRLLPLLIAGSIVAVATWAGSFVMLRQRRRHIEKQAA